MSIWMMGKKIGEHFRTMIKGVGLLLQLRNEPVFIKYHFSACNKFLHHFRGLVLSAGGSMLSGICCAQGIVVHFIQLKYILPARFFFNIFWTLHVFWIHSVEYAHTSWHDRNPILPSFSLWHLLQWVYPSLSILDCLQALRL